MSLRTISLLSVILSGIVLSACSSFSTVSDSDRDATGQFDGEWVGTFQRTASRQQLPGTWFVNCSNREGRVVVFTVKNGRMTSNLTSGEAIETNVSKSGRFRLVVPTEREVDANGTSNLTWIVQGSLGKAPASGQFIEGIAEFGNQGCTTKMLMEHTKTAGQAS